MSQTVVTRNRPALLGGDPVRTRPFPEQNTIGEEEKRAAIEVIESGVLSGFIGEPCPEFYGGPKVKDTEAKFATMFGAKHAITTNSATTSLQTALAAAGVGPGDEVIVPPFTMSATPAVVVMLGAVPVFADIDERTFNLDPRSVASLVSEHTRAIMVVHLFGQPADMDTINEIAKRHDLKVIEDAAQAARATYKGRYAGTLGDAGILSLNRHKIIHCGEGGVVLTNDSDIALRCQLIRNHGEVSAESFGLSDISNTVGSNFRMTEVEAAIAGVQLGRLPGLFAGRTELSAYLTAKLQGMDGVTPPFLAPDVTSANYLYAIRVDEEVLGISRQTFAKALVAEGIPVEEGYTRPLYLQPMYQQRKGLGRHGFPFSGGPYSGKVSYEKGICPVAERMYERELLIGDYCHSPLTFADLDDIAAGFSRVYENREALRDQELHRA